MIWTKKWSVSMREMFSLHRKTEIFAHHRGCHRWDIFWLAPTIRLFLYCTLICITLETIWHNIFKTFKTLACADTIYGWDAISRGRSMERAFSDRNQGDPAGSKYNNIIHIDTSYILICHYTHTYTHTHTMSVPINLYN